MQRDVQRSFRMYIPTDLKDKKDLRTEKKGDSKAQGMASTNSGETPRHPQGTVGSPLSLEQGPSRPMSPANDLGLIMRTGNHSGF